MVRQLGWMLGLIWLWTASFALAVGLGALVVYRGQRQIVHQWTSPDGMSTANLWESQPGWTVPFVPFQPVGTGSYQLVLGQDASGSYGHYIELAGLAHYLREYSTQQELRRFWESSTLTWRREGLRLRTLHGHELFVPSRYYLGGR
jgi:hypothetical protein